MFGQALVTSCCGHEMEPFVLVSVENGILNIKEPLHVANRIMNHSTRLLKRLMV